MTAGPSREHIRELLDRGAPWGACDAFRELSGPASGDPELLYWGALAHARAGATHEAHALLDRAQLRAEAADAAALLSEILSLRGRLFKDAVHRAPGRPGATALIERARAQYLAAYRLAQDPFPGVNAATLSMLLGDPLTAREIAGAVIATLALPAAAPGPWTHATLGEARLLIGEVDVAKRCYAEAHCAAAGNVGMVASMRRQLALLSHAVPAAAEVLDVLPAPSVVAFAGHMVDAPDRPIPRFPAELVPAVAAEIRGRLAAMPDPIVFSSAACGADLLFVEAALDRGAEVNLVLPFKRDDFVRTSVAIGGSEWLPRFDAVLARANRIVMAIDEQYLGDDVLFEHAARLVEGLAKLRADQVQTVPSLLCAVDSGDSDAAPRIGGAQATLARWKRGSGTVDVIDVRELRREAAGGTREPSAAPATAPIAAAGPRIATAPSAGGQRTLKTMLFADFAGYSRLDDAIIPQFQRQFLELAAGLIDTAGTQPLEAKTWGDALYAVFDDAGEGAEFALRFAERMRETNWAHAGMADAGQVRVALHAGPVFRCFDPMMGRDSHFGSNVTRAARIEPITPPGAVYASEAFAATLASSATLDYAVEYVGVLPLAKGYGESRVYRLERR